MGNYPLFLSEKSNSILDLLIKNINLPEEENEDCFLP